jgi:hypothetical protein
MMRYSGIAAATGIGVLSLVLVLAAINPATLAKHVVEEDDEEDELHVAMQVDIANTFEPFGTAGFFKLLADFTDMSADDAHVAISNVQCDEDGTSPFGIVAANANVGAGNSELAVIELNSSNLVDDVSFKGEACTYHVDIEGDAYDFPVTDIALANTNDTESFTPLSTASATIHADLEEIGDEVVASLGDNSEASIDTEGGGVLEVTLKEGDLANGVYNVTLTCASPAVDEEFADALDVRHGEGLFETELGLAEGTYDGCEVGAGELQANFTSFDLIADEDDEAEEEET